MYNYISNKSIQKQVKGGPDRDSNPWPSADRPKTLPVTKLPISQSSNQPFITLNIPKIEHLINYVYSLLTFGLWKYHLSVGTLEAALLLHIVLAVSEINITRDDVMKPHHYVHYEPGVSFFIHVLNSYTVTE